MQSQTKSLKFDYNPKYLRKILILGIMYLVLGFSSLYFIDSSSFLTILIFIGFVVLTYIYFWKSKGYVSIDENGIYVYRFLSKHIAWEDFKGMRYYNDAIRLLYNDKSLDIKKDFIFEDDLKRLEDEIKKKLPSRI